MHAALTGLSLFAAILDAAVNAAWLQNPRVQCAGRRSHGKLDGKHFKLLLSWAQVWETNLHIQDGMVLLFVCSVSKN